MQQTRIIAQYILSPMTMLEIGKYSTGTIGDETFSLVPRYKETASLALKTTDFILYIPSLEHQSPKQAGYLRLEPTTTSTLGSNLWQVTLTSDDEYAPQAAVVISKLMNGQKALGPDIDVQS